MNTKKLLLVLSVITSILGVVLPSYADITYASLKSSSGLNTRQNSLDKCQIKGRNKEMKSWKSRRAVVLVNTPAKNCSTLPKKKNVGSFKQPKIGGLRIDACVRGSGWKKTDSKRCDTLRLKIVATKFCKSKGFKKSVYVAKGAHKGLHAILAYKKTKPSTSYWKRKKGHEVIKNIVCK